MSDGPSPCVEEMVFEDPQRFLSYLDLRHEHWGADLERTWLFRGQRRAEWRLVPSAWRAPAVSVLQPLRELLRRYRDTLPKTFLMKSTAGDVHECVLQCATETEAVHQFAGLADGIGLPSEEGVDSGAWLLERFHRQQAHQIFARSSFFQEPSPIHGLAQHHGVPTRLLDWTRNPKIAAFFAAEDLFSQEERGEQTAGIAVWAVDQKELNWHLLRVMTCRRSEHSFLHAQDGLFLWSPLSDQLFLAEGGWPAFEDVAQLEFGEEGRQRAAVMIASGEKLDNGNGGPCRGQTRLFLKVALTADGVPELLSLLLRERISRALLMPTYDHVARSLGLKWKAQLGHCRSMGPGTRNGEES